MKTRTILLSLLLSATVLAFAPSAEAGIPERCPEKSWTATVDTRHTVAVHSDCTMDVTLFEGIICLGGAVGVRDEQVGPVHVVQYYCRSPNEQPPLEIASVSAVALDPCPEYDLSGGVLFDIRTDNVYGHCHVWVGLIDAYRLCGTLAGFEHEQVREDVTFSGATGQPRTLHVVVNYCAPIIYCTSDPVVIAEPADLSASASTICMTSLCLPSPPAMTWCGLKAATPGANPYTTVNPRERVWGTDTGCDVDVEPFYACAPPSGFVVDRTVGPVHARVLVCDGGLGGTIDRLVGPLLA